MILLDILDTLFLLDVLAWLFSSRVGRVFLAALVAAIVAAVAFGLSPFIALGIFLAAWIASLIEAGRADGKSFHRRRRRTA